MSKHGSGTRYRKVLGSAAWGVVVRGIHGRGQRGLMGPRGERGLKGPRGWRGLEGNRLTGSVKPCLGRSSSVCARALRCTVLGKRQGSLGNSRTDATLAAQDWRTRNSEVTDKVRREQWKGEQRTNQVAENNESRSAEKDRYRADSDDTRSDESKNEEEDELSKRSGYGE